jgi:hypothetical protein
MPTRPAEEAEAEAKNENLARRCSCINGAKFACVTLYDDGGVSFSLSWPSPIRQLRDVRVLTGSRAVHTCHCGVCLGLCLGRHRPPPHRPGWRGGGLSDNGPFSVRSRSMLRLPCLPLTYTRSLRASVFRTRLLGIGDSHTALR